MTADHLSPDDSSRPTSTQPVVEVRTYRTKPGRRAEFVELFTSRGGPAQREYGMTVLGPDDPAEMAIERRSSSRRGASSGSFQHRHTS